MKKSLLAIAFLIGITHFTNAQLKLIAAGDTWKYHDSGFNLGTTWSATNYNDVNWPSGNAQFGYGDGDETTLLNYGPNPNNKYITSYFRKSFNITNIAAIKKMDVRIKRDDGIVIYVNGTQIYRDNMPTGTIAYNTFSVTNAPDDGNTFLDYFIPLNYFVQGNNNISVELHQVSLTSSDLSFDFELIADTTKSLARNPYLQSATENSIIVRWRTKDSANSMVRFGLSPNALNDSVFISGKRYNHIVQIQGLQSASKYFYSVGTSAVKLQGDTQNYFLTHPPIGTEGKYNFWVAGDCGTSYQMQYNVRNEFEKYRGNKKIDGFLLLGDNAYNNGLDNEYQSGFFDVYKEQLKHFNLWPAPGNHDYWATSNYLQGFSGTPYFNIFSSPQNGQSGGVPSNNPAYYSYNYGNVHFVSLDSYGHESGNFKKMYDTTSAQIVWLKNDLAANSQRWTILYWHHPPYTKGSHNSDTEGDLAVIRENVLRIIERYKVDLVLNGHSHQYERSVLLNGHYGIETSFNPSQHAVSTSTAIYDGTPNSCPYIKNGLDANGTVYLVAGNAGKVTFTSPGYPHNAMAYSENVHGGSLMLEFEANRMDCKFIGDDGVIRDKFTMMKDAGLKQTIATFSNQTTFLSATYVGNYNWSNGLGNANSVSVIPAQPLNTYTVSDNQNCVVDTFNVNIVNALPSANFTFPTNICQNKPVKFIDQSTQTPFAWTWTFAGANLSNANTQNPIVTFVNAGSQNVSLVVTNLLGVSTVFNQTVFVNAAPTVSLTASNYVACKNGTAITLSGTPNGGVYNGFGLLGNSFFPSSVNPGNNNLSYTYADNFGCANTTAINIIVNALPIVSVGLIPDTVCLNSGPYNLVGSPLNGTFFGAGVTNNTYTPVPSGANFNPIYYTFTDTNACTNIDTKQVYVSNCTGLQDIISEKKIVLVYPNPNGGSFMIKTTKNILAELVILDEAGRLVRTVLLNKTNNFMLPVNLKSGYYFLKGKVDGVEVSEKIVVGR
jgi:hypothetical protein